MNNTYYINVILIMVCVFTFGLGQQSVAQTVDSKPYQNQIAQIEERLKVGDVRGAMQDIDEVLQEFPDAAEIHYAKALLFGQLGDFDIAVQSAKQAYELGANILYANYLLELYKSKPDLEAAVLLIGELVEENPNNRDMRREEIMLLHKNQESERAFEKLDEARQTIGESDTLDVLSAEILIDLGKKGEAQQLLQQWVGRNSPIRQVYSALGYIYSDGGKYSDAVQVLNKGLKNSGDNNLYLDLADVYERSGKQKSSFESLKKAFNSDDVQYVDKHRIMYSLLGGVETFDVEQLYDLASIMVLKYPRVADSHMAKGDLLWRKGSLQEARSLFLTSVGISPQHVDAWRMLINIDLALNDVDGAINHGIEALNVVPNNPILLYFTGLAYFMKEEEQSARTFLESALDNSEQENDFVKSGIYAALGDLYHKIGEIAVSDAAYKEAIRLDSTNVTAMNNLAYYLSLRKVDLEKAAEYSKTANALQPDNGTFQDTYAWVLFQQGDFQEAKSWMEKALKNSTPSAVLYEHYGDILFKVGQEKEAIRQWEKALALLTDKSADKQKLELKISEKKYVE